MRSAIEALALAIAVSALCLSCAWCTIQTDKNTTELSLYRLQHNCHVTGRFGFGPEVCK